MNFDHVPAELRALKQWTVWRPVLRRLADGSTKVTKPPYRADDPSIEARVNDPNGWCTFEQAVACCRANASVIGGIGFMLTEADPYVVLDLDDKKKVPAATMGYRDEFERQVLALGTYTEHSPSDTGAHAWLRARMGVAGKHLMGVGSEAYAWQRFITVTGRPLGREWAGGIVDGQAFINSIGLGDRPPEVSIEDDASKPCDLPDQEVLNRAASYVGNFADRYCGRVGCEPGEWSHTFVSVLGILDRVTGSVAQLRRLVDSAPMVTECGPAGSGESRPAKARRTFVDVLSRVRRSNRAGSIGVAHGRQVWQAIEAERERMAGEAARAVEAALLAEAAQRRAAEEAAGPHGRVELRGSKNAPAVMGRFRGLGGDPLSLRVPPGRMGELVMASMHANPVPYLKYALPAALSVMAGLVARAYVPDLGGPLNMNFVLLAPSATGKTVTMDVWEDFLRQASDALPVVVKPVDRLIKNGTASVQGIWPVFEQSPSCTWFIEEASAQFSAMSNPKSITDENLRNLYNELYDSGKHSKVVNPPRSVANRNAGIGGVRKLCVSTYWTTTPEKFQLTDADIKDGFASRVVLIHHDAPGGDRVYGHEDYRLPPHLLQQLTNMLTQANHIDRSYETSYQTAESQVIRVSTAGVTEAWQELDLLCHQINNEAIRGDLPKVYQMLSRVPMNTRRLACLLAIVENQWAPVVTHEQLTWAHNYLMHNAIGLLAAMDAGEVGDNVSDEVLAAARLWKDLARKGAMKGLPGVSQSKLLTTMASHVPFRKHKDGRSKAAANTIRLMVEQGLFEEVLGQQPARGRPAKYLLLTEDARSLLVA